MKVVKVEAWDLVATSGTWYCVNEIGEYVPMKVWAFGLLVHEDDDFVRIATLYSPDAEQVGAHIIIPKGCIIKIEVINDCSCTVTEEGRDTMAVEEQV